MAYQPTCPSVPAPIYLGNGACAMFIPTSYHGSDGGYYRLWLGDDANTGGKGTNNIIALSQEAVTNLLMLFEEVALHKAKHNSVTNSLNT